MISHAFHLAEDWHLADRWREVDGVDVISAGQKSIVLFEAAVSPCRQCEFWHEVGVFVEASPPAPFKVDLQCR